MNTDHFHHHGGMPELHFERLGIKAGPVLDFSVNISPLGPPKEVLAAWQGCALEMMHYPSIAGEGIIRFYQERFGLSPDSVMAGNGSTELIYLVPRVLKPKCVTIVVPSYHDYTRASKLAGAEVIPLVLFPESNFEAPDFEKLSKALERSDALFLGNPNNPTGTVVSGDTLLDLAERFPEKWILVDEAFVQFLDNQDTISLISNERLRPNIVVFHSLTKFYALPGVRLGCAISHPQTISRLLAFKEPWTVNRIAEIVAALLISCRDYEVQLRTLIRSERIRMQPLSEENANIRFFPPSANFVLAQTRGAGDLDGLLGALLREGLYVRDCRNFFGLEGSFFRFCIRGSADNDLLLAAIERYAGASDE